MLLGKLRRHTAPSETSLGKSRTLSEPPQWEYRNLSIPLQVQGRGNVMQMGHRLDPILEKGVLAACQDGWEPAEPVKLVWLAQQGRVRRRLDQTCVFYESAIVRLRRRRPQASLVY